MWINLIGRLGEVTGTEYHIVLFDHKGLFTLSERRKPDSKSLRITFTVKLSFVNDLLSVYKSLVCRMNMTPRPPTPYHPPSTLTLKCSIFQIGWDLARNIVKGMHFYPMLNIPSSKQGEADLTVIWSLLLSIFNASSKVSLYFINQMAVGLFILIGGDWWSGGGRV